MASLVETTLAPFPYGELYNHVAVSWNNATLIWGGFKNTFEVFHHLRGKWTVRTTSGDLPKSGWRKDVQLINDKLYMLVPYQFHPSSMDIYCLDLHTWIWKKLSPSGKTPSYRIATRSWTYKDDIYFFGGYDPNNDELNAYNEVFSYNISSNLWKWPNVGGELPLHRCNPWIIISDETVFLFGGSRLHTHMLISIFNDLHTLDMSTMIWRKVHGNMTNLTTETGPKGSCHAQQYTFTCISESAAVLFGESCSEAYTGNSWKDIYDDDCWHLNLQNTKQNKESSSIWTKIPISYPRYGHASLLQPLSKRLWIIGGMGINSSIRIHRFSSSIMKLNFNQLKSLKDLAMDCVARNICAHDPRLAREDQMTRRLRDEIEAYKCEIGDQYSCPDEDWRNGCLLEEKSKSSKLTLPL